MRSQILLAIAVAALATAAGAQDTTGKVRTAAIAGMVRDQFGRPLGNATLVVDRTELKTVTNDSGLFFQAGIPAGPRDFSVTRIGYAAVHFSVDLAPDTTLMLNIPMRAVQNIAAVDVKGARVSAALMRDGFYRRQELGLGSFLSPESVEKMSFLTTAAQLLRDVRGVTVRCGSGGRCTVTARRGCLAVMVNKVYKYGQLDDVVTIGEVYAIEVYERALLVPSDFTLPGRARNCGLINVWTKGYAEP